jgi:hypothetical protein
MKLSYTFLVALGCGAPQTPAPSPPPPVEAVAIGVPVQTSSASALPPVKADVWFPSEVGGARITYGGAAALITPGGAPTPPRPPVLPSAVPNGADPMSARGNMWGDAIGEEFGAFGLSGINTGQNPVEKAARAKSEEFRQCYATAVRAQPSLQGMVEVRFRVLADGKLADVVRASASLANAAAVECVVQTFARIVMEPSATPRPAAEMMTFPLYFGPRDAFPMPQAVLSSERLPGQRRASPSIRQGPTKVNGRLPPEVIQRIVRQNFGRFRMCYESGLRTDPTLSGTVTVHFVIDGIGAVQKASDGGSTLASSNVIACMVKAVANLSFPQPEGGGSVTVDYPVIFAPGD